MKHLNKTITLFVMLAGILFATTATHSNSASAQTVHPSVSQITGSRWNFTCPSTFNNYLQVPYANRSDSGAAPITLRGRNLHVVHAVTIRASGYTVSIKSKSATSLVLDIRAGRPSESPKPVKLPWISLIHRDGVLSLPINPGLMPTMYVHNLSWGQCTWYAGAIRRIQTGRPIVNAYRLGVAISPNPNSTGFPRARSILMTKGRHMSFVESMSETGRTTRSDGSIRITHQLRISQYNATCAAEKSTKTITMVTLRSRSGTYSFMNRPVVAGLTVDSVAQ